MSLDVYFGSPAFLSWPAIQILMHLRHGRTTSKTRATTPIVLHSPQQHLHPPHRSSLLTRLRLRAPSRPRLVGRARHGTARVRTRLTTSPPVTSHNKAVRVRRTKSLLPHHTRLALSHERTYLPNLSPPSLDNTRDGRNASIHANLKMCHYAPDHHHLWCDKVNEKKTLSIVLLVS